MDESFAKAMGDAIGADFAAFPGVSRLETTGPTPVPRFDRAAVHASNPDH